MILHNISFSSDSVDSIDSSDSSRGSDSRDRSDSSDSSDRNDQKNFFKLKTFFSLKKISKKNTKHIPPQIFAQKIYFSS